MELQALSNIYRFNYIIHQVDNPIMAFSNFPWGSVPTLHLSYHLGEHYNSVRLLEDPGDGPVMTIGHELKIKNPLPEENSNEERKGNGTSPSQEAITVGIFSIS